MGIKGLNALIKDVAPKAITHTKYSDYIGKKIAIDMSLLIYRFVIAIRNRGSDLTDEQGNMTTHIHGVFIKTMSMLKNGILPMPVFDGKAPQLKSDTLDKRKKRKENADTQLSTKKLTNKDKIKFYKRSFRLTNAHIKEIKELFTLMGFNYAQSIGEADSQCAAFNINNNVHGIATEDMDTLAFGAPLILKNFSNNGDVIEIHLKEILKHMDITYEQFIDICIIMGSDYSQSIKGIGPKTIYNIYKKTQSMPAFIAELRSLNKESKKELYKIPENYLEQWKKIKAYYINAKILNPKEFDMKWKKPDRKKLLKFLCTDRNFNKKRVEHDLDILFKIYNEYTTYGRITSFYKKKRKRSPRRFPKYNNCDKYYCGTNHNNNNNYYNNNFTIAS